MTNGGKKEKQQQQDGDQIPFKIKILAKKKSPQPTMDKYFPVLKPKKNPIVINFQGFPIKECRYESEVGLCVYQPPLYTAKERGGREEEASFCRECMLRPCITVGRKSELSCLWEECIHPDTSDPMHTKWKMLTEAEKVVGSVFGESYVNKHSLPLCVKVAVNKCWATQHGEEEDDEEEDPDLDLVKNALTESG